MVKKKIALALIYGFVLVLSIGVHVTAKSTSENVYVIPIEDTVEKGLSQFLKRSFKEAEENNAAHIILNINTPGGAVDAALEMADTINSTDIPVTAFVNKRALSAGAYLALNADDLYMAPGGMIGAAAVIDMEGNAADKKVESLWLSEMEEAASKNSRDPKYALAMADMDVNASEVGAPAGELLTLNSERALEVGYTEGITANLDELLMKLNLENAKVTDIKVSFAESVARIVTHPVVIPILLSIGSLGLIMELFSPGFGIPGILGITSLVLFFFGHFIAGLAGTETILLFIAGIVMILLEFIVPGGIVGVLGICAVIISLFLASGNIAVMSISLTIAITVAAAASILFTKVLGKNMKFFKKLVLNDSTNTESGYISNENRLELIGKVGVTLTPLRPSGTIVLDDERIDVVSEGTFIAKDKQVKIVKTEGSRIVVREI